jgi:hypothetical protein
MPAAAVTGTVITGTVIMAMVTVVRREELIMVEAEEAVGFYILHTVQIAPLKLRPIALMRIVC